MGTRILTFLLVLIGPPMLTALVADNEIVADLPSVTATPAVTETAEASPAKPILEILARQINPAAVAYAFEGLDKYDGIKDDRLIIIDFSLPSTQERFFLVNPQTGEILFKKHVAHGQGSGKLYATTFSNKNGSHMSSLGFFKTAETYTGKHGHSLRLDGLQKGLNHAARARAVVIHQADYVSETFMKQNGYLGRSWGCPALPSEDYSEIITEIQHGTLILIYHRSLEQDSHLM